jgi:hypothetical protein
MSQNKPNRLKQGLDAPSLGRNLQLEVTSGTAEMAKNSILTDGEIASGLVLTKRILRQRQYMWIMMMFKNKYPVI